MASISPATWRCARIWSSNAATEWRLDRRTVPLPHGNGLVKDAYGLFNGLSRGSGAQMPELQSVLQKIGYAQTETLIQPEQ